MNNTTHPVTKEEVMALQDGELAGKEWEAVAGHVAFCRECNEFLREMEQTSRELRTWKAPELDFVVEQRMFKELEGSTEAKGVAKPKLWRGHWSMRRWAIVLGACTTALIVGLEAGKPDLHRMSPVATKEVSGLKAQVSDLSSYNQAVSRPAYAGKTVDSRLTENLNFDGQANREEAEQEGAVKGTPLTAEEIRQGPMIAESVELAVVAKDVGAARGAVEAILAKHHGYAASLAINTEQNGPRSLQASLRIPARELISALTELKALGAVQTETQKGEEVTQQHADLVARLKNSRETEKRLQEILRQRTGKISDVLAVEQEIARVRGDIEQMEAEQKALEHRVDFATIELNLTEEYKEKLGTGTVSVGRRLRNAAVTGLRDAYENLVSAAVFIMSAAPTLLLWALILFLPARWFWKRRQRWMWGEKVARAKA